MTVKSSEGNNKTKGLKPPWKPGQSGNPKGRPKKEICIPDILNRIGDEEVTDKKGNTICKREAVLRSVYSRAVKGENWAVQFIADRTEGKAVERMITQKTKDKIILNPRKKPDDERD